MTTTRFVSCLLAGALSVCARADESVVATGSSSPLRFNARGVDESVMSGAVLHFGGELSESTTWSAQKTHVVYGTLTIPVEATLTIERGAVVKFLGGGIITKGALIAKGVTFADIADDDVGGDTCGDGWTQPFASYTINGEVVDDDGTAFRCLAVQRGVLLAGETMAMKFDTRGYLENGIVGALEHSGAVSANETWSAGESHVVYGALSVLDGATLTIEEGAVVRFVGGGITAYGSCIMNGVSLTDIDDTTFGGGVRSGAGIPLPSYRIAGNVQSDDLTAFACRVGGSSQTIGTSAKCRIQLSDLGYQFAFPPELVSYSTEWDDSTQARVIISDMNGTEVELVNSVRVASGVAEWNPPHSGFYEARHITDANELWGAYCYIEGADIHFSSMRSTNQVWTADRVHVVGGEITIEDGSSLIIEPGAVVKFMPKSFLGVRGGGELVAEGVIFTHINDDSVGGDSLGDGEQPIPLNEYRLAGLIKDNEDTEYRYGIKYLNGTLAADETWVSDRVYVIGGTLNVPQGVVLTIPDGTVVKFTEGSSLTIATGARCEASGAIFTHIADDTVGGDTNGDEEKTKPVFGRYSIIGSIVDDDTTDYRYQAPIKVSGTIGGDTVWSARTLIHVTGDVTIKNGVTLTIQPGAIIKFDEGKMLTVSSGATLNALGSRAQPIVFTSIKDDNWGGDTDENDSQPQPGDWRKIAVFGAANMSNCQLFYGAAGTETDDILLISGGSVVFTDGLLAHGQMYAVGVESGHFFMTNSVITDFFCAFRHWPSDEVVNSVISDCSRLSNNDGQKFANCIIQGIAAEWDWSNGNGNTYRNCLVYNVPGSGLQTPPGNFIDKDGNIWGEDPKFKDAAKGDFRVADDSPCLDAGDTTVAPARDHFGQPRVGAAADIGIYEIMPRYVSSDVDLRASGARVAESAVIGDEINVTWTVENNGTAAAHEVWRDKVELVSARGEKILLGEKTVESGLAVGGRLKCSGKWKLPVVPEGEYTVLVSVNHVRDIFEGVLTANNATVSNPIRITVPVKEASEGADCTIEPNGENVLHFHVGKESSERLITISAAVGVTAYFGETGVPTATFNIGSARSSGGEICFVVPDKAEDVYVLLANSLRNAVQCEVKFSESKVAVLDVSPRTMPYDSTATVRIEGAGLDRVTGVAVRSADGAVVPCDSWRTEGSGLIVASVDGSMLQQGADYRLVLFVGQEMVDSERTMSVMREPAKPEVWARMNVPETVRDGRQYVCSIEYGNNGNADAVAPLLQVVLDGEGWIGFEQDGLKRKDLVFVGVGASGDSGVLVPGEKRKIEFVYTVGPEKDVLTLTVGEDSGVAKAAARMAQRGEDSTDYFAAKALAEQVASGEPTASIFGRVSDEAGYPISDFAVTISNGLTSAVVWTDENGRYKATDLIPGLYSVYGSGNDPIEIVNLAADSDVRVDAVVRNPQVALVYVDSEAEDLSVVILSDDSLEEKPVRKISSGVYSLDGMKDGWYTLWAVEGDNVGVSKVLVENGECPDVYMTMTQAGCIIGHVSGLDLSKGNYVGLCAVGFERVTKIQEDGTYLFGNLPAGVYAVTLLVPDFEDYDTGDDAVVLESGACCEINIVKTNNVVSSEVASAGRKLALLSAIPSPDAAIRQGEAALQAHPVYPPISQYKCSHNMSKYRNDLKVKIAFENYLNELRQLDDEADLRYAVIPYLEGIKLVGYTASQAVELKMWKKAGVLAQTVNSLISTGTGILADSMLKIDDDTAWNDLRSDVSMLIDALQQTLRDLGNVSKYSKIASDVINIKIYADRLNSGLKAIQQRGRLRDLSKCFSFIGDTLKALSMGQAFADALKEAYAIGERIRDANQQYADAKSRLDVKLSAFDAMLNSFLSKAAGFNIYHDCTEDPPPVPPPPVQTNIVQKVESLDPNEVAGPIGEGDPETERFMRPGEWMTYTVYFENSSNATAGAQEVYVTNPLSEWLDLDSFEMGEVAYANQNDLGLVGLQNGMSEADLSWTAYRVQSNVMLDKGLSTVGWYLRIVDPTTVTGWPEDPFAGFLMPNDETHRGEGHLTYRIRVREDAPRNVVITNTASIVFDYNEAIETDPFWWNTAGWPLTLGEAVNNEALDWSTGGAMDWLPMWDDCAADELHDAVVSGIGNNTNAWVKTIVDGPGTVSFAWCGALASRNTKMQFLVDGTVEAILSGSNDWERINVTVYGEGEHALMWRLQTGRSGALADDFSAIDCVEWIPAVPPTLEEALNPDLAWSIDGDADWHGVAKDSIVSTRESWAAVSGLGDEEYAGIETRVYGSGLLCFDWAVSCEEVYDELVLFVDGKPCKSISGECGWKTDAMTIEGKCWHTVRWEYVKDEMDEPELVGDNRAMLDNVVWVSVDEPPRNTESTPVPVPFAEIDAKYKSYLDAANGDYEAAALAVGKNGYAIWECYVAGLDPDDPESKFRITDIKFEDGELKVTWSPDLKDARKYTEFGRKELGGTEEWTDMKDVNPAEKNDYKFRKVTVDMP